MTSKNKATAMNLRHVLASLALVCSLGAQAAPMTNADLVKLIKSGLGEALILQSIDGAEPRFDTSADGLIQLKEAGASDAIIQRVLRAKAPAPQASIPGGQCVFRSSYNHIGIEDGARFLDVGFQQASLESSISAGSAVLNLFTAGLTPVSGKSYAVIDGARAEHRVRERKPVFVDLNADRGLRPGDLIKLVRFDVVKDKRTVPVAEASESLFTSDEKIAFPSEKLVPLRFEMTVRDCQLEGKAMSVYKATLVEPLVPGEYAIAYGEGSYYAFGID
jgi:hypothetical protein